MADIDDFDIDLSTARAWADFEARLAEVISMMDDTADLTIATVAVTERAPYVRFRSPVGDLVRAEAAGNASLGENFQLGVEQLAAMEELGWQPPDADSPDFRAERSSDASDELSRLAVAALRDVYGAQHPVFLAPDHLAEVLQTTPATVEGEVLDAGDLTAVVATSRAQLNALIDAELLAMFGHAPLRDEEGDVAIRVGSAMLFLRTSRDAREVVLFAPVVHDVAGGRSRAAEVLNDLNVEARWVKFQLVRDRVFVTASVQAHPFVPAHLNQAVRYMSEVADSIDDELARKLNGRTTFDGLPGSS